MAAGFTLPVERDPRGRAAVPARPNFIRARYRQRWPWPGDKTSAFYPRMPAQHAFALTAVMRLLRLTNTETVTTANGGRTALKNPTRTSPLH
ncbi:MAG: hypothetical protein ABI386_04215 [Rhodanobacter sp.]